jgi:hypothetical protein
MNGPEAEQFFQELAAMAGKRREVFSRKWTIAFRLAEGPCFLLDLARDQVLSREWKPDADAVVLCNLSTVSDMAEGKLDVAHPKPGQVCVITGDHAAIADLGRALAA